MSNTKSKTEIEKKKNNKTKENKLEISKRERYKNRCLGYSIVNEEFKDDFVVLDFEATGLNSRLDEITQIGAIRYKNNEISDIFTTYVNPEQPIRDFAKRKTGINNETVKSYGTIEEYFPELIKFLGDDLIITHFSHIKRFLIKNCERLRIKKNFHITDTLDLSLEYIKDLEVYQIETLTEYLGLQNLKAHDALDDCKVIGELYKKIKKFK